MIVRTRLIDDLIDASVLEGCDRVLNLAAGFDTRPYRLNLPPSLDWVEADLGPIVEEKEELLAGEKARCQLRRERVDLTDPLARAAFLLRATTETKKTLVLTEGLLVYLDEKAVRALGRDLVAQTSIRWWILDVLAPAILHMLRKGMGMHLANAPMKFAPIDGVAFFEKLGWKARDVRSFFREAARLRRVPMLLRPFALLPEPDPRKPGGARWSAAVRFERG